MRGIYKVLYFINGMAPTLKQRDEVLQFGPHVAFRNAQHIDVDGCLEQCDAVAGPMIPARYAAAYPQACSIIDFYAGKLEKLPEAPSEALDPAPDSGAGDPATFDPFASVDASQRASAGWKAQG